MTQEQLKKKHKLHGTHGKMFVHETEAGKTEYYPWNLKSADVIRGYQRKGIRARDLAYEAVYSNERTSPRIEVPRSIILGMRLENSNLTAADVAIFWRCFAQARLNGIDRESHSIRVSELMAFLGWLSLERVKKCLARLRVSTVSNHFNHEGCHGRQSMPMLILLDDAYEVANMQSSDRLYFALPKAVCDAVLVAKDYALVDLNAISRFKSRCTATMFMRLSLMAGYHEGLRHDQKLTFADLRTMFGLPKTARKGALLEMMHTIQDDLEAISGPRRRFNEFFTWPTGNEDFFIFNTTSSVRRVRDVKPEPMSEKMKEMVCDRTKFRIKHHEYPSLLVIRQAATLHCVSPLDLSEQWRLQVLKARSDSMHTIAGMTSDELFKLIADFGADSVFEAFADKADLPHIGSKREGLEVYGKGIRPLRYRQRVRMQASVTSEPVVYEEVEVDSETVTFGDVELDYGAVESKRNMSRAVEVDDEEIPY